MSLASGSRGARRGSPPPHVGWPNGFSIIHAPDAQTAGKGVNQGEFRFGLAIEAMNPVDKRVLNIRRRLADTGKDYLFRIAPRLQDPEQFA